MEALLPLIIGAVGGGAGGNIIAMLGEKTDNGGMLNTVVGAIAGLLGGGAAGGLISSLSGGMVDPASADAAAAAMQGGDLSSMIGPLLGALGGGAVAGGAGNGVVALVRGAMGSGE